MPLPLPYNPSGENSSSFDFTFEAYPDHSHPNQLSVSVTFDVCTILKVLVTLANVQHRRMALMKNSEYNVTPVSYPETESLSLQ